MTSSRGSHLAQSSDGNKKRNPAITEKKTARREAAEKESVIETSIHNEKIMGNDDVVVPVSTENKRSRHVIGKVLLVILAICVAFGMVGLGTVLLITHGPSEQAKTIFVRTFRDTGTLYWVPRMFLPDEEVKRLNNPVRAVGGKKYSVEKEAAVAEVVFAPIPEDKPVIELVDISGPSWHGKMLIVRDASLVRLAVPKITEEKGGYGLGELKQVEEFCEMYGAIAGITAGGFDIESGKPSGYIIKNGKAVFVESDSARDAVGFTADHKLVVGRMTPEEALDRGVVEGLCWQPLLIVDGIKRTGIGGGYNPRAAIGQCADGTVILILIEGRMVSSLGATYDDLASFMEEQGCINAINLDSGRSSVMVYDGKPITKIAVGAGIQTVSRAAPNAFVVMPEGWTDD